jgi:hypothetical protein
MLSHLTRYNRIPQGKNSFFKIGPENLAPREENKTLGGG